jgi:hypothetical protein
MKKAQQSLLIAELCLQSEAMYGFVFLFWIPGNKIENLDYLLKTYGDTR